MDYKVYLGNKAIILTDEPRHTEVSFSYKSANLDEVIHRLNHTNLKHIVLYSDNLEEDWNHFKQHFDVIEAAGGLVNNEQGKYLFIYRNGKWDLPKGKMESGETPEETALREVKEECGIKNISIDKFLFDTYHLFTEKGKKRLKITHWFLMKEGEKSKLSPQIEEGIEKVEWIDIAKNKEWLKNSYENIKLLIQNL